MTEWHMRFMSIKMSPSFIDPPLIASTLRLGIWVILNASEGLGFLCLFATVCSTWVSINVGTSRRSRVLPEGDWRKPSVWWSNCMVSRNLGIMCFTSYNCVEWIDGSIYNFIFGVFDFLAFGGHRNKWLNLSFRVPRLFPWWNPSHSLTQSKYIVYDWWRQQDSQRHKVVYLFKICLYIYIDSIYAILMREPFTKASSSIYI